MVQGLARRLATGTGSANPAPERTPWMMLTGWIVLWFLPLLSLAFAVVVSPSIRSWGRLSVVLLYLVLVIAGLWLQDRVVAPTATQVPSSGHDDGLAGPESDPRRRERAAKVTVASLALLLLAQISIDHRPLLGAPPPHRTAEARQFASQVTALLPAGCPVLQLPLMAYPEAVWPTQAMASYDHFWMPLFVPSQRWSFGIVSATAPADGFFARYTADSSPAQLIARARADGFCAVQVDRDGLSTGDLKQIDLAAGTPDVVVGRWQLTRLRRGS
jgi:hypothetical protein